MLILRLTPDHAARLHGVLQSLWSCDCEHPHYAHLRLEQRDWNQPPCFQLNFPMAETCNPAPIWTWFKTEVRTCETLERQVVHEPNTTSQSVRTDCIPNKNKGSASRSNLMESLQRLKQSEKKKKVAFAVIPGLQVASVQLTESTATQKTPEEPKVIDNLCKLLRSADQSGGTTCVGRVTKEESSFDFYALSRSVILQAFLPRTASFCSCCCKCLYETLCDTSFSGQGDKHANW